MSRSPQAPRPKCSAASRSLEARGYAFEAAEASVALLMRRQSATYRAPFELVDYKVIMSQREREDASSDASIKIRVAGDLVHTAAEGNGPVSALDAALRKALVVAYPEVTGIRLEDYKVRILDGVAGTAAVVRVLIESSYGEERWTTVGASSNVLEASWIALADGIEYGLGLVHADRESMAPRSGPAGSTSLESSTRSASAVAALGSEAS